MCPCCLTNSLALAATPYRGARHLVRDLGNARLLTMRGDGHTAYGNGSPTRVDSAIETYLTTAELPPAGTTCRQDIPFGQAQPQATASPRNQIVPRAPHRF